MSETPKRLSMPSTIGRETLRTDQMRWILEKLEEWAAYREQCRAEIREADLQMILIRSEIERRTTGAEGDARDV